MDDIFLLIQARLEGELDAAQTRQLQTRLRDDPAALEAFVQTCLIDQQLRGELRGQQFGARIQMAVAAAEKTDATSKVQLGPSSVVQRVVAFFSRPTPLSMTVAAMVIAAFLAALAYTTVPHYQRWASVSSQGSPEPPVTVAELSDLYDAEWAQEQVDVIRGAQLVAGHRIELRRGLVEVTFHSGAKVLLEGPAALTLNGPGLASLDAGRLTANVPKQARGFTIETKQASIVDLGTEFGVGAEPGRATTVRVFKGSVVVEPISASKHFTLLAGDVLSIAADGTAISERQAQSTIAATFVRELPDVAYADVVAAAKPLAWWRFNDGRAAAVADASGNQHHGVLGGAERAATSAPGLGQAMDLRGAGYVEVPSLTDLNTTALSVETWVRLPTRSTKQWERIVETDYSSGFVLALCAESAAQFKLTPNHATLGINNTFAQTPTKVVDGRWHHIVGVWDGKTLLVYADGEPGRAVEFAGTIGASPKPLRIGANTASIPGERFAGSIDEVAIYDRALSVFEIKQHYEAALPAISSKRFVKDTPDD